MVTMGDGWTTSKFSESNIGELVDDCLLQSWAIISWRYAEGHTQPFKATKEIILFASFVERGLAVPT